MASAHGTAIVELYATGGENNLDNNYSIQAFTGNCNGLTYLACSEDGSVYPSPSAMLPRLVISGVPEFTWIYLRVRKSNNSSQNTFAISVHNKTAVNDVATNDCAGNDFTITRENGNAYRFLPTFDGSGGLVAEIYAAGQDLGEIHASTYIHEGPLRSDEKGVYYLDRSHTIEVENQPTESCKIKLYIDAANLTSLFLIDPTVTDIEQLNATKTSDACGEEPSTGGTFLNLLEYEFRADGNPWMLFETPSFSTFYIHGGNIALPVNVLLFKANRDQKNVVLNWKVDAEKDVRTYEIERRSGESAWGYIGAVNAGERKSYQFVDKNPEPGTNYYRLKIIDHNNKSAFSDIRQVGISGSNTLSVYPNPAQNYIILDGVGMDDRIQIFNDYGEVVKDLSKIRNKVIEINDLLPGTYSIRVTNESGFETSRFVKN